MLTSTEYARCDKHFHLHKKDAKNRKHQRAHYRISRNIQESDGRAVANEPWLIFI